MENQNYQVWFEVWDCQTIFYKEIKARTKQMARKKLFESVGKEVTINLIK